jgi:acetamidase/formamidase
VEHYLNDSVVSYAWDQSTPARLTIDSGDTVVFDTRDSADHYYSENSTARDVRKKGPLAGHPLTGPVHIRGAKLGDTLAVEILEVRPSLGFGWTAIRPGRGLLPKEDFPNHYLQIWDLSDQTMARMKQRTDIAVAIMPFPGILGTALKDSGSHSTIPPRQNGGNMDIKYLCAGSTVYLPVFVEGGLFCVGDAHAAQGDGEVCITAIEMAAKITLRFRLLDSHHISEPQLRVHGSVNNATANSELFATTAHGPDLYECSQRAVRYMIDYLVKEKGLSREEAYVLCSVCVDLKINEVVSPPNWLVSAFLPEYVFVD